MRDRAGKRRTAAADRAGAVLDVLGLVEHDPVPGDRGQRADVAGGGGVGGQHDVGAAGQRRRVGPVGAVQHPYDQAGREPGRLPLPVAQHRQRADQQGRPGPPVQQQRQQLHRLAQPHVVGQAGAQPEPVEKGQPGQTPPLVRAELPGQPGGRIEQLERAPRGRPASRSAIQPLPLVAVTGSGSSSGGSSRIIAKASPGGHRAAAATQERQPGLEAVGVQVDPSAAQLHQRHLRRGQVVPARTRSASGRRAPVPTRSPRWTPGWPPRPAAPARSVPGCAPRAPARAAPGPPPGRQQHPVTRPARGRRRGAGTVYAPAVSSTISSGRAIRSAGTRSGYSRAARPSPVSSRSWG